MNVCLNIKKPIIKMFEPEIFKMKEYIIIIIMHMSLVCSILSNAYISAYTSF